MVKDTLKASLSFRRLKNVGFANLEEILHSCLKNISSCATEDISEKMSLGHRVKQTLRYFEKAASKAIAKLVNGFQPLTIFVKELHRKSSTEF